MRIFRKLKKCANSKTDAQKTQALIVVTQIPLSLYVDRK